jgi:hypothetical protein
MAVERLIANFGTPSHWRDEVSLPEYFRSLGSLDANLIELAVDRSIDDPDRHYMPRPGELRAYVSDEIEQQVEDFNRRRRDRAILLAAPREENDWHSLTPAERAAVNARLAAFNKAIAETGAHLACAKPSPAEFKEDPENPPIRYDREQLNRLPKIDLTGWRLPEADDPRVLARMREIGLEPIGDAGGEG